MAFYRCGNSKAATFIDGAEPEGEVKLKSLGMVPLDVVTGIPPGITYGYSSTTHSAQDNFLTYFKDAIYCIWHPTCINCYKDGVWSKIELTNSAITFASGVYSYSPDWASEVNGIFFASWNGALYYVASLTGEISNGDGWVLATSLPTNLARSKLCAYDSDIYQVYLDTSDWKYVGIRKYSPTEKTWTNLSSFEKYVHYNDYGLVDAVVHKDEIHIFISFDGGTNNTGTKRLDYLKYSIKDNTWTKMTSLPYYSGPQIDAWGDTVYLLWSIETSDHMCHLFKLEDGVMTQYPNCILRSASKLCGINGEGWFEHFDSSNDDVRLGRFFEAYELVKE